MNTVKSLNHTKWECKYHIVWIPKYRRKSIYKELRPYLGDILKELSSQKECTIEEGAFTSRSCTYFDFNPTEVLSCTDAENLGNGAPAK